jgi:hypothetical protein
VTTIEAVILGMMLSWTPCVDGLSVVAGAARAGLDQLPCDPSGAMSLARVLQTLKIKYPIRDQLLWRPTVPGRLIQCCYAKGGAALRSMHGKEVLNGRLYRRGERRLHAHFPVCF